MLYFKHVFEVSFSLTSWHNFKHINFKLLGIWVLNHFEFGFTKQVWNVNICCFCLVLTLTKICIEYNPRGEQYRKLLLTCTHPRWALPCLYVLGHPLPIKHIR